MPNSRRFNMENNDKTKAIELNLGAPPAVSEGTNFSRDGDLDLNVLGVSTEKPSLFEYIKSELKNIKKSKNKLEKIKDLTYDLTSGELEGYDEYKDVINLLNTSINYYNKYRNVPIEHEMEHNLTKSLNLLLKEQAKLLHKKGKHAILRGELEESLAPKVKIYSDWLLETAFTENYANLLRFGTANPEKKWEYQGNKPSQYFKKSLKYAGLCGAGVVSALIGLGLMYLDQKYSGAAAHVIGDIAAIAGFYKTKSFSEKHDEEYQKLKEGNLESILDTKEMYE